MMMVTPRPLLFLLGAYVFAATIASVDVAATSTSLPDNVFWDNDNWPSDLISVGEFNNDDDDDSDKVLDFLPLENPHVISGQTNLNLIGNDPEKAQVLTDIFNGSDSGEVEVKTWNGAWIQELYLPDASNVPNFSEFQLTCGSSWSVKVHYNNGNATQSVSIGNYLVLAVVEGAWITEGEYDPSPHPTAAPTKASENKYAPLLEGTVLFAQSQIFPSKHGINGDSQPHLTALRKTLVMLRPHKVPVKKAEGIFEGEVSSKMMMIVRNVDGAMVSSDPIEMKEPDDIPKQSGWVDLGDTDIDSIDFPSSLVKPYVIKHQSNLNAIKDDKEAGVLTDIMTTPNQNEVEIQTWDGSWVRNIYLPVGSTVPADSKIQITCDSGYSVSIHYPNTLTGGWRTKKFSRGQTLVFILVNNVWLNLDDIEHMQYVFGHGFFTATLDADWVRQGMTIEFIAAASGPGEEDKVGILDEIKVGGVTELVITAIDAGFLTPPRNQFTFRNDETAHREYFETAPVSRLVIVQYESMHLTDIMLPSGKNYTEVSDDNGGWHSGDMRQYIGKILLSHGIDLANYGISSSKGNSESSHPFTCALLAAHNTVGMYQNGLQVHGGSGGNGMITLDSSIGNEFSHEVGHNYGVGHYPGGFDGSVHRPSSEINSSWGWDSQQNLFNPNFDSSNTGDDQCLKDECQSAYMGKYRYGTDSMAGGSPMWVDSNRFTMYTPHVAKRIQNFLENKAVWDPTSSTGFRKFDQLSKEMKEFVNDSNGQKVPRLYRVPVTTIVGYYDSSETRGLGDYVYPAMHGAYGFIYEDDGGSGIGTATGCELVVKTSNGNRSGNGEKTLVYTLTTDIYHNNFMNKFHVNVATIDGPYKASIYCFNQLRTTRTLDGPKDEQTLTFTVNGIAFDDGNNDDGVPTATPVKPSTKSPTFSPTHSPTTAPHACPEVPQTEFVIKIKNNAPKLRSCEWLAKKSPAQISRTCKNKTKCHGSYGSAQAACPATCAFCGECNQNVKAKFYLKTNKKGKVLSKTCNWLANKPDVKKMILCANEKLEGCHKLAYQVCPQICYEKSGCDRENT